MIMLGRKIIMNLEEEIMNKTMKLLACILALVVVAISLFGCKANDSKGTSKPQTNDQTKANGDEQSMGRYMEKQVTLPEFASGETIIKIIRNSEKQFEVYTAAQTNLGLKYLCYTMNKDNTWESKEPKWLNDAEIIKGNSVITDICIDEDGNLYATYDNFGDALTSHIIMSKDGGNTAINIDFPYLKEEVKKIEGKIYYPRVSKLNILANGNLVIYEMWNSSLLIFANNGEKIDELKLNMYDNFTTTGNNIILKNDAGTGILVYNTETKEADEIIDYSFKGSCAAYAIKEDGTIFIGDNSGIHRLPKDGTLWETTVDGSLNSMSMPSLRFDKLYVSDNESEEYYAVYQEGERGYQLKHYYFDQNVSAFPEHEITVYSLKENNTIRQAISLYQSKNSDIKVNYVVAMGEEEANISDYIRALNTELLAGKGADLLVLDGLPIEAYIEKGVLEDISDVISPINSELLDNITNSYNENGAIYNMPIRFSVPVVVGSKEVLSAVQSIEDIKQYIEKSGGKPFTASQSYKSMLSDYLALYSKDIFQDEGLSDEKFIQFLNNLKVISDNIKASESGPNEAVQYNTVQLMSDNMDLFLGNVISLVSDQNQSAITKLSSMYDSVMLYAILNNKKLDYGTINDSFLPNGIIGLNKGSKEQDIAKQFIQFLYSDDVQSANLNDGFPVNSKAMQEWIQQENKGYCVALSDHEGNMVSGEWPTIEEREDLFEKLFKSVKRPIEINRVLDSMIIEESLPFFMGEKEVEQVASSLKTKVNTYLSE